MDAFTRWAIVCRIYKRSGEVTVSSMWNWSVVLAVACGVCSSSGCKAPDPAEAPDQRATPAEPTWRSSLETFQFHLGRVETGWTAGQVLDLAGQPDEQGNGYLYYTWIEDSYYGGYYCSFSFIIVDGVVSEICTGIGHETRIPVSGGDE